MCCTNFTQPIYILHKYTSIQGPVYISAHNIYNQSLKHSSYTHQHSGGLYLGSLSPCPLRLTRCSNTHQHSGALYMGSLSPCPLRLTRRSVILWQSGCLYGITPHTGPSLQVVPRERHHYSTPPTLVNQNTIYNRLRTTMLN